MTQNIDYHDDEIDLKDLLRVLWIQKKIIIFITALGALISVIVALSLPNIYLSESTLLPTSQEDSLSSKLGSLSTLSNIAGVALPKDSASKSDEAIERIKSFDFFSKNFLPNIKLENITAVKKWLPDTNKLVYDKKIYDSEQQEWIDHKPSEQQAFKFYQEILGINAPKNTAFVRISIQHESPALAQRWVEIIIKQINETMRTNDADQAKKSISFLNKTASSTNVQSIKDAISSLLENQMQTLMLTSSNEMYVFKIIDAPIIPERKFKPSRAIICILGTLISAFIGLFIAFIQHYRKSSKL